MTNIWLLEKYGRIPSDEYNGVVISAKDGDTLVFMTAAGVAETYMRQREAH